MFTKVKPANLILLGIYLSTLVLLFIVWIQPFTSPDFLLRDTFAVASIPSYYGLISNLGVLLWCTAAIASLFSANIFATAKQIQDSRFFLCFGSVSFWLAIDDFFLIHENTFISETKVYCIYILIMLGALIRFRKYILKTDFKILFVGFLFFFASIIFDKYSLFQNQSIAYVIEDGFKLLGIISWCFYFIQTSLRKINHLFTRTNK